MKTDLQIAYENEMELISQVAERINVSDDYLEAYGKYKAKISLDIFEALKAKKMERLF